MLFGVQPDPRQRHQEADRILRKNAQEIARLAQVWCEFQDRGKEFAANIYDEDFLRAYLAYYLTANVCKVQLVLLDLFRAKRLKGQLHVVDVGVGAGTTAVAVFDFLIAWATVCDLYGVPFPITGLSFTGFDANENCLKMAHSTCLAFAEALDTRSVTCGHHMPSEGIFTQAAMWARQAEWRQCDLENTTPVLPQEPIVLFAANVLNELSLIGRNRLAAVVANMPHHSVAIVIEPGDKSKTEAMNGWKCNLLRTSPGLALVGPCGQEYGSNPPDACDACWNGRREALHQPILYRRFHEALEITRPDSRSFDEFTNRLLSWSYTCLASQPACVASVGSNGNSCRETATIDGGISSRYIGTHFDKQLHSEGPDRKADSVDQEYVEYMKLCPGPERKRLALERRAGKQVPRTRYGQQVTLHGVKEKPLKKGISTLIPEDGKFEWAIAEPNIAGDDHFLRTYGLVTERAVDEIAFRLFGFPAMRAFQHRVLERVLTGQNIVGIAATGGGKSECFILPAMLLPGVTIVISPLKSLMQDQYDQRITARYGLENLTTYINGDVGFAERQARLKRIELGYYKLVYLTPEQLDRAYVLNALKRADDTVGIRYIAFDEAHCISQWGHDFRPSYLNMVRRLKRWGLAPLRIALTATASPDVLSDICEELELNRAAIDVGGDVFIDTFNRPELNLTVRVCRVARRKSHGNCRRLARSFA